MCDINEELCGIARLDWGREGEVNISWAEIGEGRNEASGFSGDASWEGNNSGCDGNAGKDGIKGISGGVVD